MTIQNQMIDHPWAVVSNDGTIIGHYRSWRSAQFTKLMDPTWKVIASAKLREMPDKDRHDDESVVDNRQQEKANLSTLHERVGNDAGSAMAKVDPINHPSHYTLGGIETIDVIEAWGLGFHLGNAIKYISRAGKKDQAKYVEDLAKARWYIEREIARNKGAK